MGPVGGLAQYTFGKSLIFINQFGSRGSLALGNPKKGRINLGPRPFLTAA